MSEENTEHYSSEDLDNLQLTVERFSSSISTGETDIFSHIWPIMRGLGSHQPEIRCGHAIVFSALLDRFHDRINEVEAEKYISDFKFTKKTKKSAGRTAAVAKILARTALFRSKIYKTPEIITSAISAIIEEGTHRMQLYPFVCATLAQITQMTNYQFLETAKELLPSCLDSILFWFIIAPDCPEEQKQFLPPPVLKSLYNEETAEAITRFLQNNKQPWLSPIWKYILDHCPNQDMLTYWPAITYPLIRSNEQVKKYSMIQIIQTNYHSIRPDQIQYVFSATFIKLINSFLAQSMISEKAVSFLDFVITETDQDNVMSTIGAFSYIDGRLPGGFNFHRSLYDRCTPTQLRTLFEALKNTTQADEKDFQARTQKDGFALFKLTKFRALFLASGKFNDHQLSCDLFDHIFYSYEEQRTQFADDLVNFDNSKQPEAATLSEMMKEPETSHFEICHKINTLCGGSDAVDPIDCAPIALIEIALKHSNCPLLIRHAYEVRLKEVTPEIPTPEIVEYFQTYRPTEFNKYSIKMIFVVVMNCEYSLNLIPALFRFFVRTLADAGGNLAPDITSRMEKVLERETGQFSFQNTIPDLFAAMTELSNRVIQQHEKLIMKAFKLCLYKIIMTAQPLNKHCMICLSSQFDSAIQDLVFKSVPHFTEEMFIELPTQQAFEALFPVLLKHLPQAKRVQRRIILLNLVTKILDSNVKILETKHLEFNKCVIALIVEDYGYSKDDEKKQAKVYQVICRWLQMIERKKSVCPYIQCGEYRRKINVVLTQAKEQVRTQLNQIIAVLSKIEIQVHPKHRLQVD